MAHRNSTKAKSFIYFSCSSLAVLIITACSAPTRHKLLEKQGILSLSDSNPYHGANQLLSDEAVKSTTLRHFLYQKKGPQALQIIQADSNTEEIHLYYVGARNKYIAHCHMPPQSDCHWILTGPYPMTRKEFLEIRSIIPNGETLLVLDNHYFPKPEVAEPKIKILPPPPVPVKSEKNTRKVVKKAKPTISSLKPSPTPQLPLTFDQEALLTLKDKK